MIILMLFCVSSFKIYQFITSPIQVFKQAMKTMDIEQLQTALEQSIDISNVIIKGEHPIQIAFKNKRYDFMDELAKAGAKINITYKDSTSFVGTVLKEKDNKALDILGKYGADFHASVDTLGLNALTYASIENMDVVLPTVIKYTDRNRIDNFGFTPLHYSDYLEDKTIKYLIEIGENPNTPNIKGNTPLHIVSNVQKVKLLHNLGANINTVNECGTPPIFYQVGNGNGRIYEYMNKNGGNKNVTDGYGQSILTYALMTENELLHEKASNDFCEYYPKKCESEKKRIKNAGIKALATAAYTATAHKLVLKRIAQRQASRAAGGAIAKQGLKKIVKKGFTRLIPIVGWGLAARDGMKYLAEVEERKKIIEQHKQEAARLAKERKAAQAQLRKEFMNCNPEKVSAKFVKY